MMITVIFGAILLSLLFWPTLNSLVVGLNSASLSALSKPLRALSFPPSLLLLLSLSSVYCCITITLHLWLSEAKQSPLSSPSLHLSPSFSLQSDGDRRSFFSALFFQFLHLCVEFR